MGKEGEVATAIRKSFSALPALLLALTTLSAPPAAPDVSNTAQAAGAVYLVTSDSLVYAEEKITAPDGEAGDRFAYSVAIWGDTALVGAFADDVGTNDDQGSAYVFVRSGTTWTQQAYLTGSDGAAGDGFGRSVFLSDDTVLVGAPDDDIGANFTQGSAYFYTLLSFRAFLPLTLRSGP